MREFRIAFAQCDGGGKPRPEIADALGKRLAAVYGGFTRFDARGGYIMADGTLAAESVYVFDIATAADAESVAQFAEMAAAEIRRAMAQESVYFRNIDGGVRILAAAKPERKAAPVATMAAAGAPYRVRVSYSPPVAPVAPAKPERKAADDKPPETLAQRAAEIRTIAERMAAADARRGGGGFDAAEILATAADSILAE